MIIQITMEIKMADYSAKEKLADAKGLAIALVQGQADWPDTIRIDVCDGKQESFDFKPHK